MKSYLIAGIITLFVSSCSSTNPIITANPDQTTATSGTIGSSRITDGEPKKYNDTLTVQTDSALIMKENRQN